MDNRYSWIFPYLGKDVNCSELTARDWLTYMGVKIEKERERDGKESSLGIARNNPLIKVKAKLTTSGPFRQLASQPASQLARRNWSNCRSRIRKYRVGKSIIYHQLD